jgi:hypothetical protein
MSTWIFWVQWSIVWWLPGSVPLRAGIVVPITIANRSHRSPEHAHYETNRQVIHLPKAKRCLDQGGHLCRRASARFL